MFAKNKVSQSMIDAVNSVLGETKEETTPTQLLDEASEKVPTPTGMKVYGSSYGNSAKARKDQTKSAVDTLKGPKEKELIKDDEIDETGFHKAAHGAKRAGQSHFEFQGKKYPVTAKSHAESVKEDGDCVTEPQAKDIAKKEVGKHEKGMHGSKGEVATHVKKMHKEEMSFAERLVASLQEDKTTGTVEIFTDNNLGEEEMTDKQKAKREKIVMSMKKGEAGMKQRYGKNWKNVMYATATKQAMKEDSSDSYEELTEAEVITAADTPERVTTDMLQGRVEGGKSNAFKSVKLALRTDGEMKAPEIEKGEDTKEKQKISTTPGAVDIKLDDKLTTPPQKYFSSQEAITSEEVRGELAHIRSKQKNDHKAELDTFEKKVSQKEEVKRSDIPAFLRKVRGDKKLTPSEVKAGSKDSISHPDNLAKARNEEVEQIAELKKSTLGSYIKKASDSNNDRSVSGLATDYADKVHWDADEKNDPTERKMHLRSKGIARAADKLTKEEVELSEKNESHTHAAHYENEKGEWTGMNLFVAKDDEDAIKQAHAKCKDGCRLSRVERHVPVKEETELDEKVIAGTPGWKEMPKDVKDKSGAVHTPMSRAKDLARKSFKRIKNEMLGKISN